MADHDGADADPSSFLSEIIGTMVNIKLNSGVIFKGELQSVDGYMNVALADAQEFVNGKQRSKFAEVFLRGNNLLYIAAQ